MRGRADRCGGFETGATAAPGIAHAEAETWVLGQSNALARGGRARPVGTFEGKAGCTAEIEPRLRADHAENAKLLNMNADNFVAFPSDTGAGYVSPFTALECWPIGITPSAPGINGNGTPISK